MFQEMKKKIKVVMSDGGLKQDTPGSMDVMLLLSIDDGQERNQAKEDLNGCP